MSTASAITTSPSKPLSGSQRGDQAFSLLIRVAAVIGVLILVGLIAVLASGAAPSVSAFGLGFLTETNWDPPSQVFGAAAYIYGTVVTSIIGLALATLFAIGAAIFVSEYAPLWLGAPIAFCVELLVTIPSVVYGLWGYFNLAPFMRRTVEPFLKNTIGPIPIIGELFKGPVQAAIY